MVESETTFGQTMVLDRTRDNFRATDPLAAVRKYQQHLPPRGRRLWMEHRNNRDYAQVVTGEIYNPAFYYFANWRFFGAAAGLRVLAILSVLCLLRDYRRLGRRVSLSPIEIAWAFDAALLQGVDTNSEVGDIVKQTGHTRIRYGVLKVGLISGDRKDGLPGGGEEGSADRLIFAETKKAVKPAHMQSVGA